MRHIGVLLVILLMGVFPYVSAQEAPLDEVVPNESTYLLLDKGLQFRITENVNALYNYDFEKAERGFAVMQFQYPEHPLPYFLQGLATWWKIAPDIENKRLDNRFLKQMDVVIDKAKGLLDNDPENKEAAFFLAGAYGFQGRLLSERKSWTKATFAGKNALKYLNLSKGDDELNPELLLGDALFNYFSVWIPENYPILKPVVALFPKGNKELGLKQLEDVAQNAFYARVEAQYFLFRLYASEEKQPYKALAITDYLHQKFPNNPYFHRSYARHLYTVGRITEAKEESMEILQRIDDQWTGYESNSGRYAAFYIAQYFDRIGDKGSAKRYYLKTLSYGEESESQESGYYLYALIALGKMENEAKNKAKAKEYFNKVKKYAKRKHPAHKEAREYIKKNKL
ncbi:tetratricopeptide repeat protein [Mongoliitalea daihaiensis]|uniref:tetratricopeptide repeat protein n=1 Tax=Mongoliitalea daihaiensis TaxID=2782006 RepID=UPI001F3E08F8|nr:tol-pal system protein YbgF [Mongoliitalea daihaiensis]UJP67149.1 tol-pal system protein YbgF [Mongoliitalea daihaiensis]